MATVFVEARSKGQQEGTHIDDFVVEDHADHILKICGTQKEAIEWAKANLRMSRAYGTSTTKRPPITGGRLNYRPAQN